MLVLMKQRYTDIGIDEVQRSITDTRMKQLSTADIGIDKQLSTTDIGIDKQLSTTIGIDEVAIYWY